MAKWENKFIIFQATHGPKVIIESLNTYGEEGWECCSMLTVATTKIVAFLKRRVDEPVLTVDEPTQKIEDAWVNENGKKK